MKAFDVVQALMIQYTVKGPEIGSQRRDIVSSNFHGEAVTVHGVAFVIGRQIWESMSGFESKPDAIGEMTRFRGIELRRVEHALPDDCNMDVFEQGNAEFRVFEDPGSETRKRGVVESFDVVQGPMIQLMINRREGFGDVRVVHHPAQGRVERTF